METETEQQATKHPKSRKTSWKPGTSGNPGGRPKKKSRPAKPPQLLKDMQAVYGQPETADRTEGQRQCRKWLQDSPAAFMARLAQMQAGPVKGEAKERPDAPGPAEPEDEAEVRTVDLIDRLLQEFEAEC